MSILNQSFYRILFNFRQIANYSVIVSNTTNSLEFKSNFTTEEQTKILGILNGSNPDQLSRYNVPQTKIKKMVSWKNKKGPFRTLSDVLEVDGLGEKALVRICEKIITENVAEDEVEIKANNTLSKRCKQFVTPPLNGNITNELQSTVGIHLGPMGISWAKLSRAQNKLSNWNYEDFSSLPKKMLPSDSFDLAYKIIRKFPPADIYIFEANPSSPQSTTQSATVSSYTQQLELTSMLTALINTSIQHNVSLQKLDGNGSTTKTIENKVFYLRAKLPARLFRTLVGTERVSALTTITELVHNDGTSKHFALPCTPITLDQQLRNAFLSQAPANKELLGQALMLVITFMDLCVYKNPVSVSEVAPNKNNKK